MAGRGNSLRALLKYLDSISNGDIANLNIPTCIPLIYEFDQELHPIRHYYFGDAGSVQKAIEVVALKHQRNIRKLMPQRIVHSTKIVFRSSEYKLEESVFITYELLKFSNKMCNTYLNL